jgi:DNA mismatch endonuclease, patch repair protein
MPRILGRIPVVTDTRSPEDRKRIMAAVRRRDTAPELALRLALYRAGLRGWRCDYRGAPGRPDIAWPGLGVAVFVDGAFWHGHPSRHKPGRSGVYWDRKIADNVARDKRVDAELEAAGWKVLRVWDFAVRRTPDVVVEEVRKLLLSVQPSSSSCPRWLQALWAGSSSAAPQAFGSSCAYHARRRFRGRPPSNSSN